MQGDDFDWAAALMERRRRSYERFSPVFWRPAEGVRAAHAAFLRGQAERGAAVALRSPHGFVVASIGPDRYDVDDFAVEHDDHWASDGQRLLHAVSEHGPLAAPPSLRVVTARRDTAKRTMLEELGLRVTARWWVKALHPTGPGGSTFGPVDLGVATAVFVPAPPVYAPGGPVCILGDVPSEVAAEAAGRAEAQGAVLAVVTRDTSPDPVPAGDAVLDVAGFDNVSEFFEGRLGGWPSSAPGGPP
jgi:hypothetical protein